MLSNFELLRFFYQHNGIAFNAMAKVATFTNRKDARRFKILAPDWLVQIMTIKESEKCEKS